MRFTQHPTNNRVLGAPPSWNQAALPCGALPVTVVRDPELRLVSYWRPTDAERKAIADGALIELSVFSGGHPPVALAVEGSPE